MRIAIIGSNDLGQLMAYHAINDNKFDIYGFFDNKKEKNTKIEDYGRVVGTINDVEEQYVKKLFDGIILGVGYTQFSFKRELYERFYNKIPFVNIIHSSSYIDSSVKLGAGIFILPRCVIDMGCEIEDSVVLNTGVTIAHHTIIRKHSFLAPASAIAGYVQIGESNFIGINATILSHIKTCNNIIIGAGAVLTKNVSSHNVLVGNPAKIIRTIESGE